MAVATAKHPLMDAMTALETFREKAISLQEGGPASEMSDQRATQLAHLLFLASQLDREHLDHLFYHAGLLWNDDLGGRGDHENPTPYTRERVSLLTQVLNGLYFSPDDYVGYRPDARRDGAA